MFSVYESAVACVKCEKNNMILSNWDIRHTAMCEMCDVLNYMVDIYNIVVDIKLEELCCLAFKCQVYWNYCSCLMSALSQVPTSAQFTKMSNPTTAFFCRWIFFSNLIHANADVTTGSLRH